MSLKVEWKLKLKIFYTIFFVKPTVKLPDTKDERSDTKDYFFVLF